MLNIFPVFFVEHDKSWNLHASLVTGRSDDITASSKMNDEGVEEVARRVHAEFDRLDAEVALY